MRLDIDFGVVIAGRVCLNTEKSMDRRLLDHYWSYFAPSPSPTLDRLYPFTLECREPVSHSFDTIKEATAHRPHLRHYYLENHSCSSRKFVISIYPHLVINSYFQVQSICSFCRHLYHGSHYKCFVRHWLSCPSTMEYWSQMVLHHSVILFPYVPSASHLSFGTRWFYSDSIKFIFAIASYTSQHYSLAPSAHPSSFVFLHSLHIVLLTNHFAAHFLPSHQIWHLNLRIDEVGDITNLF